MVTERVSQASADQRRGRAGRTKPGMCWRLWPAEERLAAAVERADGTDATATRDSILEEVSRFLDGGHSQDDLTIAVLRVDANGISNGG